MNEIKMNALRGNTIYKPHSSRSDLEGSIWHTTNIKVIALMTHQEKETIFPDLRHYIKQTVTLSEQPYAKIICKDTKQIVLFFKVSFNSTTKFRLPLAFFYEELNDEIIGAIDNLFREKKKLNVTFDFYYRGNKYITYPHKFFTIAT